MAKSQQDYEIELEVVRKEYDKVGRRISFLVKKINGFKTNDDKTIADGIANTIEIGGYESLAAIQWRWILHHWHDETSFAYKTRSNLLYALGINTNGIAGHKESERVKQFKLSIHSHHDASKFLDFYKLVKQHLITYSSPEDKTQVVGMQLLLNMFGDEWEHASWELEINAETNLARFIELYSKWKKPTDWMTLEDAFKTIEKYHKEY